MINLMILIDQPDTVLGVGYTVVRVYSDTSESGSFASMIGAVPIVQDQESVQFTDVSGTTNTWYKTSYYGAVPGEGDKSDAFKGDTSTSYATVLELRKSSNKELNVDDFKLQQLLDGASAAIDGVCNHPLGFVAPVTPTTRIYGGSGSAVQLIDECISISLVEVKISGSDIAYETWDASDWIPFTGDPRWANFNDTPFDALMVSGTGSQRLFYRSEWSLPRGFRPEAPNVRHSLPMVRITARWGYAAVCPPTIKTACIAQATRWLKRGESSWADTMSSPDTFGSIMFRKPLDADIQMMLSLARLVKPALGRS